MTECSLGRHSVSAESIEATLREAYAEASRFARVGIVACEDGSSDGTADVLRGLAGELPIKVISDSERKGYAGAVIDGMRAVEAPYLATMDGDGQIDPADLARFWEHRDDAEVISGSRTKRRDSWARRAMSRGFYLPYRVLTGVTLHDPSCPLVLTRREVAASLLPRLGEMTEGFWWEFNARVRAMGLSQLELPINHRERTAGATQVYRPGSLARIAVRHLLALPRIRAGSRTRRAAG